ncbi:biotin--[acetyl-CoA-carboxylase] ligase [Anaeromyxobacter dehalogenans]|uniref:Bifunctional ligase/repressor BirA n=1 Tax=Anaeromyxobacter dehalogenans (strain 2CP-C) TaxID=290397 RepID=Q2IKH8_ANADE|nr:biotin--[acetyl-CoA-carboxylase] ligase [Anaeromyxobacter dehalogenans]ABC82158.1 Biotin--acetyl-CoA-carboxylase ligase [Anaeromyxobacter dehalogenans 2CP-C]
MATEPSDSAELVLAFLAEAGDEVVSGEAISDKLGLTRAAVWKHVNALRARGYRIDAVPARGYRLAEVPDRLTALELRPLLNTHDLGQVLHAHEELASTNDRARELAEEGAVHGEVVIAERQTAGRGRRGRAWISPPRKNLYFSVVLRPDLPPARAPEITLVASLAVCDALRQAGVDAGIKWPNDVLAGGRKIAGILTELAAEQDRVHWMVVGVGVNVNAGADDFPDDLRGEATSVLLERGEPAPRALFAAACLTALEGWLDVHEERGFAPIREAWRERSVTLGREVRVAVDGGELAGTAEDIDEAGALLVRTASGLERVLAGDVRLVRPR